MEDGEGATLNTDKVYKVYEFLEKVLEALVM